LQDKRGFRRGLISDLDGIKLKNHTMVSFLQKHFHFVRADDFRGANLEASEGIGVRLLGEAHI
jgi:hypothetical protein